MSCRRWIVAAMAAVGGCREPAALAPPTVHWGEDVCAVCSMIVTDDRFAAALAVSEGGAPDAGPYRTLLFDDLGCLLRHERDHPDQTVAARWVRAMQQRRWLDAGTAVYVRSDEIHTPMASGLAACADLKSARAAAERYGGEILQFHRIAGRSPEQGVHARGGEP